MRITAIKSYNFSTKAALVQLKGAADVRPREEQVWFSLYIFMDNCRSGYKVYTVYLFRILAHCTAGMLVTLLPVDKASLASARTTSKWRNELECSEVICEILVYMASVLFLSSLLMA